MYQKRNRLASISAFLGILYLSYVFQHFYGAVSESSGSSQVGAILATAYVTPHMVATLMAVIMNVLGWQMSMRGFMLAAGILYAVGIAVFPLYTPFLIIQTILSFIAYGQLKQEELRNQQDNRRDITSN